MAFKRVQASGGVSYHGVYFKATLFCLSVFCFFFFVCVLESIRTRAKFGCASTPPVGDYYQSGNIYSLWRHTDACWQLDRCLRGEGSYEIYIVITFKDILRLTPWTIIDSPRPSPRPGPTMVLQPYPRRFRTVSITTTVVLYCMWWCGLRYTNDWCSYLLFGCVALHRPLSVTATWIRTVCKALWMIHALETLDTMYVCRSCPHGIYLFLVACIHVRCTCWHICIRSIPYTMGGKHQQCIICSLDVLYCCYYCTVVLDGLHQRRRSGVNVMTRAYVRMSTCCFCLVL